jgi:hypothetical protein
LVWRGGHEQLEHVLAVGRTAAELWQAVDDIGDQVEAVHIVQHRHVERHSDRALLLVTADVEIVTVMPAVSQAMDEPGIAVVGDDDRFVAGEERD